MHVAVRGRIVGGGGHIVLGGGTEEEVRHGWCRVSREEQTSRGR